MNLSLRQILPPTYTISFAIENDNLCPEDTILPKYSVQGLVWQVTLQDRTEQKNGLVIFEISKK
jgi:hypothetical protein